VWVPGRDFLGTIDIADAERLQDLPAGWTLVEATRQKSGIKARWRLVGNAVCAAVAGWLGRRLREPGPVTETSTKLPKAARWPRAAWGARGEAFAVERTPWPVATAYRHLADFLEHPLAPLSVRATRGYLDRLRQCPYRLSKEFVAGVEAHLRRMQSEQLSPPAPSREGSDSRNDPRPSACR
jgi:DNA (cytosine-5)-methyltransferase 1